MKTLSLLALIFAISSAHAQTQSQSMTQSQQVGSDGKILSFSQTQSQTQTQTDHLPALIATGPNSATATYTESCSNGDNSDKANFDKFVALLLANPSSTLSILKANVLKGAQDLYLPTAYLTDWVQSYRYRDGCHGELLSYSAFLMLASGDTSHRTVTKYLVTINDDVDGTIRNFKFLSAKKILIRDDASN